MSKANLCENQIEHLEQVISARDEQLAMEMDVSRKFAEMVLQRGNALLKFLEAYGSQDSHTASLDKAAELARKAIAGAATPSALDASIHAQRHRE